jgi:uncharacterized protein YoxC
MLFLALVAFIVLAMFISEAYRRISALERDLKRAVEELRKEIPSSSLPKNQKQP